MVILIAKIFENLLKLRFDELLSEDIYCLKHFFQLGKNFHNFYFLIIKKKIFFVAFEFSFLWMN